MGAWQGLNSRSLGLCQVPTLSSRPGTIRASPGSAAQQLGVLSLRTQRTGLLEVVRMSAAGVEAVSAAEDEANKKRWEESGNSTSSSDEWRWTLNWDEVTPDIVVGSCPRSPADVDRLVDEAKIDAILCLQSELCHEALQIDWEAVRQRAVEREVVMTRCAVRDFDHNDQAAMLPEAVRLLYLLLATGRRVYVHCTAGINRATLTVVGYFTFVQGMPLDEAVAEVKAARPQAHPYIDCWKTTRGRLVEGRADEVAAGAKLLYKERKAAGGRGDGFGDWVAAEDALIRRTFQRQLACTLSFVSSLKDIQQQQLGRMVQAEAEAAAHSGLDLLRSDVQRERTRLQQALATLQKSREEAEGLQQCLDSGEEECVIAELNNARDEIASLRGAIQEVAYNTLHLLTEPKIVAAEEVLGGASGSANTAVLAAPSDNDNGGGPAETSEIEVFEKE